MTLPSLLVVDPVNGYKLVKRNDKSLLEQLYSIIGCHLVECLEPNNQCKNMGADIYCDEEGLLKDGSVTNNYIHPLMNISAALYSLRFGGPRGICVVVSKKFTKESLIDIVTMEEDSDEYRSAMEKAIDEYIKQKQ